MSRMIQNRCSGYYLHTCVQRCVIMKGWKYLLSCSCPCCQTDNIPISYFDTVDMVMEFVKNYERIHEYENLTIALVAENLETNEDGSAIYSCPLPSNHRKFPIAIINGELPQGFE